MSDTLEQKAQGTAQTMEVSDFEQLLNKEFNPKSEEADSAVKGAVKTLVQQALSNAALISDNSIKTIEGMIAELDKKLSSQVNEIIHHKDFENIESSWRGLSYLVNNTQTSDSLKVRVLNISKKDLLKTIKKFKGATWDQSHCSSAYTRMSTVLQVVSHMALSSVITTLIIQLQISNC